MTRADNGGTHTPHWGTPQALFDELNERFNFTLDPCARDSDIAKCQHFFTPEDDGLAQDWFGNVFLNPPYGREVKKWAKKAYEEIDNGNAALVVALLPASVGTLWFHDYIIPHLEHIWFVKRRLQFEDYTETCNSTAANFDSIIVVLREQIPHPTDPRYDEITASPFEVNQ